MPLQFNNAMCVTVDEWKSAGLSYTMYENDKKRGYLRVVRRGSNSNPALIELDSIAKPDRKAKIIEMYGDPRVSETKSLLVDRIRQDAKAVEFFSNFFLPDGRTLSDQYIHQYSSNAMVLNALGEIWKESVNARKRLGRGSNTKFWEKAAIAVERLKKDTGHKLPSNARRLHRVYKEYDELGYLSLVSKKFGNDNSRKVDDASISLLNNMFATQAFKPNYADIQRQYDGFLSGYVTVINNATGELYNPQEFSKLSPSTISNYLSDWDNAIGNEHKRSGDRQKYMAKFKPYHSLEIPSYAGSIISIDDRNPPFEYAKGKRMWFYNGIDLASEAFTVFVWGKTKEGIIMEFYRQMVRNYHDWGFNIPYELECESSLNASFKESFLKEGNMFQKVRIEANNARGKRIEQYFRPLRYQHEKKHLNWLARPFAKAEANQAGSASRDYIQYDDLVLQGLGDLQTWNNMPHSVHKNKTRWEILCENQNPNLPPTNYRGIIPYIGYKTQTSCNVGSVNLQRKDFLLGQNGSISTGDELIGLMTQIEGQKIDVYWLDTNDKQVLKAYAYIDDRMICELIAKPKYNRATIERTPEDNRKREIMSAYVASIEKYRKLQSHKIDKVTVIDETPVTLNNKFVIPQLQKAPIPEQKDEVLKEKELVPITLPNFATPELEDRF